MIYWHYDERIAPKRCFRKSAEEQLISMIVSFIREFELDAEQVCELYDRIDCLLEEYLQELELRNSTV